MNINIADMLRKTISEELTSGNLLIKVKVSNIILNQGVMNTRKKIKDF